MRLLKKKIQASKEAQDRAESRRRSKSRSARKHPKKTKIEETHPFGDVQEPKRRKRVKGSCITPKIYLQAKNIVTNFGKAMASFANSDLANPYLVQIVDQLKKEGHEIKLDNFFEFMSGVKGTIGSIDTLRALMLEKDTDTQLKTLCKKVFRMISEIFIKYFSVNWIIHGRVTYKMEHLKFRYKMLRRIRNPVIFTYLKGYSSKKGAEKKQTKENLKQESLKEL